MTENWKPKIGVSIALGLLTQSFVFLYLNRGLLFFLYIALNIVTGIYDLANATYYSLLFLVICPLHAAYISHHYSTDGKRHWYSRWWGVLIAIMFLYVPIYSVRSFFYEPFSIPGSSMSPTINMGDIIVVKKYGYGNYGTYGINLWSPGLSDDIKLVKGQIYVFISPHTPVPLVKRLIGTSGDRVRIESNVVFVNDQAIATNKIDTNSITETWKEIYEGKEYLTLRTINTKQTSFPEIVVPEGSYYFLGDNRNNSLDSRYWGFISKDKLIGEVIYIHH
jgi:signal peptidase I